VCCSPTRAITIARSNSIVGAGSAAAKTVQLVAALLSLLFIAGCGQGYGDDDVRHWLTDFESNFESGEHEVISKLAEKQISKPAIKHYHHLSSNTPTTRKRTAAYRKEGQRVRKNPPIFIDQPIDWAANPANDQNWLYQKNALYIAQPFMKYFSQVGNLEDLKVVERLVLDWIHFNLTQNRGNSFKWHDMSTGIRATALAFVLDHTLRAPEIDVPALRSLIKAAALHAEELANPKKLATSNHAYFQLVGLAAICRTLDALKDCSAHMRYANDQMERLISSQFSSEGVQREHAPDYHFYSLKKARKVLDTGWFSLPEVVEKTLRRAESNNDWFYHPNGTTAMIGDTARGRPGAGSFERSLPADPPGQYGKVFPESGYAILRSPWEESPPNLHSYLIFWAGEERPGHNQDHSYAHSHADNFTFEWSEAGIPILVDSGKYSYDRDEWRRYFVSTRAHNTIEIDGKDHDNVMSIDDPDMEDKAPRITAFESGKRLQFIEAVISHQPSDVKHRRLLVLRPGEWLAVVDMLESNSAHEFTQWFHLHEDWEADITESGLSATQEKNKLAVDPLGETVVDVNLLRGATKPRIQGWISTKYLERQPNQAIGVTTQGENVILTTLLRWNSTTELEASKVSSINDELQVCWTSGGRVSGFTFNQTKALQLTQCE